MQPVHLLKGSQFLQCQAALWSNCRSKDELDRCPDDDGCVQRISQALCDTDFEERVLQGPALFLPFIFD